MAATACSTGERASRRKRCASAVLRAGAVKVVGHARLILECFGSSGMHSAHRPVPLNPTPIVPECTGVGPDTSPSPGRANSAQTDIFCYATPETGAQWGTLE